MLEKSQENVSEKARDTSHGHLTNVHDSLDINPDRPDAVDHCVELSKLEFVGVTHETLDLIHDHVFASKQLVLQLNCNMKIAALRRCESRI